MAFNNVPVCNVKEFTVCDANGWEAMEPHQTDVIAQLRIFINELRRVAPWLRFAAGAPASYVREVYVYIDNNEFTLGTIGFGDYAVRGTNSVYMVSSRNIRNGKVADWRSQYHTAQTEDLKRAVKNALKYLTPMSCLEIAVTSYSTFHDGIRETKNAKVSTSSDLMSACRSVSTFSAEFHNLLAQGVTFITPEFQKAAREYKEADIVAQTAKMRKVGALFIRIRNMGTAEDNLMVETIEYKTDLLPIYYVNKVTGTQGMMKLSDLSDELQAKLATLSMMPIDTYTEGLGVKASDTTYWVEKDV